MSSASRIHATQTFEFTNTPQDNTLGSYATPPFAAVHTHPVVRPHYDDAVRDSLTGVKSEWTLLIYLTGVEDGVEGGETLFYKEEKGKQREVITPPLKRGTALLHRYASFSPKVWVYG